LKYTYLFKLPETAVAVPDGALEETGK